MSSLNGNLIINGTIAYNAGTNLTAARQPRLLRSGTITGTTGTAPVQYNGVANSYRIDITGDIPIAPSGYSRIQGSVNMCPNSTPAATSIICTTPYIYNYVLNGANVCLLGAIIYNIPNATAFRINYLVYATLDQA